MKEDKILLYVLGTVVIIGAVFFLVTNTEPKQAVTEEETQSPAPSNTSSTPTPSSAGETGSKNESGTVLTETKPDGKTVVYRGTQFEPEVIQVALGDEVVFVNKSSSAMRLMFDIPGTVTRYFTAYDQVKSVGKDGTYRLFFNQKGTWNFYNLNGDKTIIGTINVQ